jgi:N-acyl homoserine lactone hydrolase
MSARWTLWGLRAGHSTADQSMLTYLEGPGAAVEIPHVVFLATGPANVLIDTSFRSAASVRASYPQEIARPADEELDVLLGRVGLRPADIEMIVHTHLHYDHAGNNHMFPGVSPLVQRAEIEYAAAPSVTIMVREYFAPSAGFTPPFDPARFTPVDGDLAVADGLDLLHLPGHTPGSQGVLLDTVAGPVCIPGDQVMVHENMRAELPVGLHTDLEAWERSHQRLTALEARIIPSHDMRIFPAGSVQRLAG